MVKVKKETASKKDENLDELTQKVQAHKKDFDKRKEERAKEYFATKDDLLNHSQRKFTVKITVDREEDGTPQVMKFKVRRLTQEERIQMEAIRPINPFAPQDADPEDLVKAEDQGYEVLSKVVVEPQLTADEWRKLDVALTVQLIQKISLLQSETNDADLIAKLKNL